MPRDTWDPVQYAKFRDERSRPFLDLLALVPARPGARVVDLGCGTGELTLLAHQRLGAAETLGVDRSAAMLEKARPREGGGLRFAQGDLAEVRGSFDVVLSNAALHWLPDHEALVPRLCGLLAPGGRLAVQLPDNHDHPSHRVAREVSLEDPFRAALRGWEKPRNALPPERYAELLHAAGLGDLEVRLQVYGHELPGPEQVVEWVKGSLLNEWRERLSEGHWVCFLSRYQERLLAELPPARPYFYTYRRILFAGTRPG